jgi:hypothetical protein
VDVHLVKIDEGYWTTEVIEWAAQHEHCQLRIAEKIGNIRKQCNHTHECYQEIAKQLCKEIKVEVEKLKQEHDEIMRKPREAEKAVDKVENESAETVY